MTAGTPAQQAWDRMTRRCQDLLAEACDHLPGRDPGDHYAAAVFVKPRWGPAGVEALETRWLFDGDVLVMVTQSGTKVPGVRLVDVLKMPFYDVPVDDIAPAHQVYGPYVAAAHARALTPAGTAADCLVTLVDLRGMGLLADSVVRDRSPVLGDAIPDGKTQGAIVRSWLGRSGVPAANLRRERVARDVYRDTPGDMGRKVVRSIYTKVIADAYAAMPAGAQSTFALWIGDQLVASAQVPSDYRWPSFADDILAMLSEVATGSRRGHRPKPSEDALELLDAKETLAEIVAAEDHDGRETRETSTGTHATAPIGGIHRTRPVGVGDWTRRAAAGVISETEAEFTGLDAAVDHLITLHRAAGLSHRQAEVLAWTEAGFGGREVAHRLGIDESTVSRTLKRARNRLKTA